MREQVISKSFSFRTIFSLSRGGLSTSASRATSFQFTKKTRGKPRKDSTMSGKKLTSELSFLESGLFGGYTKFDSEDSEQVADLVEILAERTYNNNII